MPSAADPSPAGQPAGAPGRQYVLTLSCPDRPGIVLAVAAYLHESGGNILESQQFADLPMNRFFMRVQVEMLGADPPGAKALRAGFGPVGEQFGMDWDLYDLAVRPRVLIMVSKEGHCLNDLLYRRQAEAWTRAR
jgi:formyltetrahydrofolate deformylase